MRAPLVAALLLAVAAAAGGCAPRAQPYRFSMPMLGQADVPAEALGPAAGHGNGRGADTRTAARSGCGQGAGRRPDAPRTSYAYGWQKDAQSGIRTVSAAGIELKQPEASEAGALAVTDSGIAHEIATRGVLASRLPAPHRAPNAGNRNAPGPLGAVHNVAGGVVASVELPRMPLGEPSDLRALVGTRDNREPFTIAMGWLAELGVTFDAGTAGEPASGVAGRPGDGPALVAWAAARGRLFGSTEAPAAGDVLVFDRATAKAEADLIAIVIGRDARGVIEMIYAGGGVIRRGFVDPTRPSIRRDLTGAVINTFLRHGKQWPPKGTRYLAGQLLAHVIHAH
jgi:hypothetical protein